MSDGFQYTIPFPCIQIQTLVGQYTLVKILSDLPFKFDKLLGLIGQVTNPFDLISYGHRDSKRRRASLTAFQERADHAVEERRPLLKSIQVLQPSGNGGVDKGESDDDHGEPQGYGQDHNRQTQQANHTAADQSNPIGNGI
jgi:hypothetical protein